MKTKLVDSSLYLPDRLCRKLTEHLAYIGTILRNQAANVSARGSLYMKPSLLASKKGTLILGTSFSAHDVKRFHPASRRKADLASTSALSSGQETGTSDPLLLTQTSIRQQSTSHTAPRSLAQAERSVSQVLRNWQEQHGLGTVAPPAKQPQKSADDLYGHVQGFFNLCLQQKQLPAALDRAKTLPAVPSLFTALLKACLDHGDFYAVSKAVEVRREAGLAEDAFCYTALLKAAAREGNPSRTNALFQKAWEAGIREAPIFNVLISQHNAQGQVKESFAVYDRMLQLEVDPDVVTMNLLIKAAGISGQLHIVEELYHQMVTMGPTPTAITFVHLFSAYEHSERREYGQLVQLFEDMLRLGIQPVTQHFVTYLGACCDTPLSAKEIRQVFSRTMAFCAAQNGDCSVYAALLKFCVNQGIPEKAVDVWKAIQKAKHKMNSWVYAAMFTACAAYKSPEHCMILTQAYHSLKAHYAESKATHKLSVSELRGQRIAFNALLNACAKTGMMRAAEELLESMLVEGPPPDIISYNTLISGYAQAADTGGAFNTFYSLCEASSQATTSAFQLRPNGRTFGAMLHSCAQAGNADSAKKVLDLMKRAGISPTAEACTSLMAACIKQGSADNIAYAFQVFGQMKAEGVAPSAVTYGCLMNGCGAMGDTDQAMGLYQEACAQGIFPSDECHNTLINVFAKTDRLKDALKDVQDLAKKRGRGFLAGVLNSLARALAPEYIDKAIHVLHTLQKRGMLVHRDTYMALIQAATQESLIETARDLYWALSKEGAVASQEAGSRLIMALCQANQPQDALAVYEDMILDNGRLKAGSDNTVRQLPAPDASSSAAPAVSSARLAASPSSLDGKSSRRPDRPSSPATFPPAEVARATETDCERGFRMTAADRLGLRRKLIPADEWDSIAASPTKKQPSCRKKMRRHRRAVFPHSRAMAALVQAFSSQDLEKAFDLYCQLRQDSAGAAAVTLSDRFMWQSLIEVACRKYRVDLALQVYDDWKEYCATQERLHRFDDDTYMHIPRLSNVTLAFLEACCRAEADRATGKKAEQFNLRVYDVCATMRQQQDRKLQATLPRPKKPSHHFADNTAE